MNQLNQTATGYADGFNVGFGPGDVEITFMLRRTAMMRMIVSHSVAKELAHGLNETLQQFEQASGQKIVRLADVNEALNANAPGGPQRGSKIIM